ADLFPTILALAGLMPPTQVSNAEGSGRLDVDGVSLLPILSGRSQRVRDPATDYVLTESLNLMTNNTRQIGARNGTYKVICTEKVETANCEFFNLAVDPLEEYPLPKPASCAGNASSRDPAWHYCRLAGVIRTESFFARGRCASVASPRRNARRTGRCPHGRAASPAGDARRARAGPRRLRRGCPV